MDLGIVFKLSLYSLIALVGLILGVAEGEGLSFGASRIRILLPYLSLPLVFCGYFLTERTGKTREKIVTGLSPFWSNLLGFVALFATAYEFNGVSHEGKLLAGTHLLLYATWIVLFQQKTIRLYWFLMALGILQLAVASVLTKQGWFGFSAMAYMFFAVWTLSIFSLWRAEQFFDEQSRRSLAEAQRETERPNQSPPLRLTSLVRSAIQHEDGNRWLTARFISGVLMTSFSALVVSAAFFAFVPRFWLIPEFNMQDDSRGFVAQPPRMGPATSVRLGDFGPALESLERVFEIRLSDANTKESISITDYADRLGMAEPLFRGAVLTDYENGRWTENENNKIPLSSIPMGRSHGTGRRTDDPRFANATVRQDIHLDASAKGVLYSLGQPLLMWTEPKQNTRPKTPRSIPQRFFGKYNELTGVSSRGEPGDEIRNLDYQVYTAMPPIKQMNYKLKISDVANVDTLRNRHRRFATDVPKGLKRLKQLTRTVLDAEMARRKKMMRSTVPIEMTPLEIATTLEEYLRDSGIYKYTLDLSIKDPQIDPVEDFLFNRKEGHCEYFATALALMIRSAGIPSRCVSGYKGGVPRHEGAAVYEIQQRFSHLWVEAWVDKDGWTTFDATPMQSRTDSIAEQENKKSSVWTDVKSTLSSLWSENILKMSLDRQEESIYKPMRELASLLWTVVVEFVTSPKSALQTLGNLLTNTSQWLSIGGFIVAFCILLVFSGMVWLTRKAVTIVFGRYLRRTDQRSDQRRKVVAFYQRFAKIMESRGLTREPDQTQQEFSELATRTLLPELTAAGVVDIPERISERFYRVRFGEDELTATNADELEDLLRQLENALDVNHEQNKKSDSARHEVEAMA